MVFKAAVYLILSIAVLMTRAGAQELVKDQWFTQELSKNDPHWTSQVYKDSLSERDVTVVCAARPKALGFQFSVPIEKGFDAIESLDRLSLQFDGQEVSVPATFTTFPYEEYDWLTMTPPGIPNMKAWVGQDAFLKAISRARLMIIQSATSSSNESVLLEIDQPIRLNGCSEGQFDHLAKLCGITTEPRSGFCRDFFCEPQETALERLNMALDLNLPELDVRPADEMKSAATEMAFVLGADGVVGFAEGICFKED